MFPAKRQQFSWILEGSGDGVLQFGLFSCWTLSIVQIFKNTTFLRLTLSSFSDGGQGAPTQLGPIE
jgi:hypothetical protein